MSHDDKKLTYAVEVVEFAGHKNIRATHRKTLEITKKRSLTLKGDCIIGVSANKALRDFSSHFKKLASASDTYIAMILVTKAGMDCLYGRGNEALTYEDPYKIIVRKSDYSSPDTVMIKANKSAYDIKRDLINYLKNGGKGFAVFLALRPIQ